MRNHVALLAIALSITFAAAQIAASPLAPAAGGAKKGSEPATQTKLFKATPAPASTADSPRGNTFQVNDEKGLLLSCIAPQIDANPDTDIFNSCTLAPGRTLDDVMHTFVGALHLVQNEQIKERAEWYKNLEDQSGQRPTQK